MAGAKKVVLIKNRLFYGRQHVKEFLEFVHTGVVFLQFLARASNGPHSSYVENWGLKICTGTPEDMLLTDLGVNCCRPIIGFVLANATVILLQVFM